MTALTLEGRGERWSTGRQVDNSTEIDIIERCIMDIMPHRFKSSQRSSIMGIKCRSWDTSNQKGYSYKSRSPRGIGELLVDRSTKVKIIECCVIGITSRVP